MLSRLSVLDSQAASRRTSGTRSVNYITPLWERLKVHLHFLKKLRMPFLTLSDFGTIALIGDAASSRGRRDGDTLVQKQNANMYSFVKQLCKGRSVKTGSGERHTDYVERKVRTRELGLGLGSARREEKWSRSFLSLDTKYSVFFLAASKSRPQLHIASMVLDSKELTGRSNIVDLSTSAIDTCLFKTRLPHQKVLTTAMMWRYIQMVRIKTAIVFVLLRHQTLAPLAISP